KLAEATINSFFAARFPSLVDSGDTAGRAVVKTSKIILRSILTILSHFAKLTRRYSAAGNECSQRGRHALRSATHLGELRWILVDPASFSSISVDRASPCRLLSRSAFTRLS